MGIQTLVNREHRNEKWLDVKLFRLEILDDQVAQQS